MGVLPKRIEGDSVWDEISEDTYGEILSSKCTPFADTMAFIENKVKYPICKIRLPPKLRKSFNAILLHEDLGANYDCLILPASNFLATKALVSAYFHFRRLIQTHLERCFVVIICCQSYGVKSSRLQHLDILLTQQIQRTNNNHYMISVWLFFHLHDKPSEKRNGLPRARWCLSDYIFLRIEA